MRDQQWDNKGVYVQFQGTATNSYVKINNCKGLANMTDIALLKYLYSKYRRYI